MKNKEAKKQQFRICLPVKLADERMSVKNLKKISYLIYNIVSLVNMAGETTFFMKIR